MSERHDDSWERLIVVFYPTERNRGQLRQHYHPRVASGCGLLETPILDKCQADEIIDEWLIRHSGYNPYWHIAVEPAPLPGEESCTGGSLAFRMYLYRRFVLRYGHEGACTGNGVPMSEEKWRDG